MKKKNVIKKNPILKNKKLVRKWNKKKKFLILDAKTYNKFLEEKMMIILIFVLKWKNSP
jgi:hypothetical protein